ncbi:hypothetical protein CDD81_6969 [Ophiocordyceps australis]|uniref:Uncharacterized protein n=1 Tax=Ophiocordyceps australis TaxID=1399860 RepID=A0A2C5YHN1_9HYPO|nr:hypothetical protein CDD81_6969 [Ophiocordyceps australis]
MASRIVPRTVKDATRFTSTVPHASSKIASQTPTNSSRIVRETPEQRVRRLRQAHLAARKAKFSRLDRVIDGSRRFLDVAHRWTVAGLVLFTAVATVVSIYSVWDMMRYNRARRAEWVEAQKKLEADALSAARIAYVKGEATEEQILLVEQATRDAEQAGLKLPSLLSQPQHRTHFEEHVKPALQGIGEEKENKVGKGLFGILSSLVGAGQDDEEKSTQYTAPPANEQVSTTRASTGVMQAIRKKVRTGGELNPTI